MKLDFSAWALQIPFYSTKQIALLYLHVRQERVQLAQVVLKAY